MDINIGDLVDLMRLIIDSLISHSILAVASRKKPCKTERMEQGILQNEMSVERG